MPYLKRCTPFSCKSIRFILYFIISFIATFEAYANYDSSHSITNDNQSKRDLKAAIRIKQWQTLLDTSQHLSDEEKLKKVNDFFNQLIVYVRDYDLWGIEDYWATPYEILTKGAGDCEDFSIAKYFTLKKLGISENSIRITYVTDLKQNKPHMVLTYTPEPEGKPVILDNLKSDISSASIRSDLSPLYSFNESGLWIAKFDSKSKRVGNSNQLSMWSALNQRM